MKVFVTGATGVLGRRVVVQLVARGDEVSGVARSRAGWDQLAAAGARPVTLDLFDAVAVPRALSGHDAVCNLATSVPVGDAAACSAAWTVSERLRREASGNLVDGALAVEVSRFVQESIAFVYADGGGRLLDESATTASDDTTRAALAAEANAARFAELAGTGVALRFGQFYGFDSRHTIDAIDAVLAGRPAELGPESAYRSLITTDDAAAAVVAALDAPSGVYNVVDDRPLTRGEQVDALASALGVASPPVRSVPDPPSPLAVMLRSQRVSNQRFRAATEWRPRCTDAWEGWRLVVAEHHRRTAGCAGAPT